MKISVLKIAYTASKIGKYKCTKTEAQKIISWKTLVETRVTDMGDGLRLGTHWLRDASPSCVQGCGVPAHVLQTTIGLS